MDPSAAGHGSGQGSASPAPLRAAAGGLEAVTRGTVPSAPVLSPGSPMPSPDARFPPAALVEYAAPLFAAAGCDGDKPATIAAGLVEADLLGHTTHGLQLA